MRRRSWSSAQLFQNNRSVLCISSFKPIGCVRNLHFALYRRRLARPLAIYLPSVSATMGGIWSALKVKRINLCGGVSNRQPTDIEQSDQLLLMPSLWMDNDALYDRVNTYKDKFQDRDCVEILWTLTKFIPCQVKNCKCKGGSFIGVMCDSYGWKDNICVKSSCRHLQSDHMLDLFSASTMEFTFLTTLVFDIINIKGTLEHESKKTKCDRNLVLENILILIHREIKNCIRLHSFMSFNIETIYGSPPFEKTNIEQILLNFCLFVYGKDVKELKRFLIISKFVIRYFDSWIWPTKEFTVLNSNQYTKSYEYYYQRYMMYCYLPRCIHSISKRYRTSMIFGQDVLRYTLPLFRNNLQTWCFKESNKWSSLTKFYCLDYLPIYLDALEQQLYADKSPIWDKHYELSHYKNKLDIATEYEKGRNTLKKISFYT